MTVSITWHCDDCGATFSPSLDDPGCLSTPPGWTPREHDGQWYHACLDCQRLRCEDGRAP